MRGRSEERRGDLSSPIAAVRAGVHGFRSFIAAIQRSLSRSVVTGSVVIARQLHTDGLARRLVSARRRRRLRVQRLGSVSRDSVAGAVASTRQVVDTLRHERVRILNSNKVSEYVSHLTRRTRCLNKQLSIKRSGNRETRRLRSLAALKCVRFAIDSPLSCGFNEAEAQTCCPCTPQRVRSPSTVHSHQSAYTVDNHCSADFL